MALLLLCSLIGVFGRLSGYRISLNSLRFDWGSMEWGWLFVTSKAMMHGRVLALIKQIPGGDYKRVRFP
jgi:hypothetical protein